MNIHRTGKQNIGIVFLAFVVISVFAAALVPAHAVREVGILTNDGTGILTDTGTTTPGGNTTANGADTSGMGAAGTTLAVVDKEEANALGIVIAIIIAIAIILLIFLLVPKRKKK